VGLTPRVLPGPRPAVGGGFGEFIKVPKDTQIGKTTPKGGGSRRAEKGLRGGGGGHSIRNKEVKTLDAVKHKQPSSERNWGGGRAQVTLKKWFKQTRDARTYAEALLGKRE